MPGNVLETTGLCYLQRTIRHPGYVPYWTARTTSLPGDNNPIRVTLCQTRHFFLRQPDWFRSYKTRYRSGSPASCHSCRYNPPDRFPRVPTASWHNSVPVPLNSRYGDSCLPPPVAESREHPPPCREIHPVSLIAPYWKKVPSVHIPDGNIRFPTYRATCLFSIPKSQTVLSPRYNSNSRTSRSV